MSLLPSIQSMVERLGALSHRPVHVTEDGSVETMADIKLARGNQARVEWWGGVRPLHPRSESRRTAATFGETPFTCRSHKCPASTHQSAQPRSAPRVRRFV